MKKFILSMALFATLGLVSCQPGTKQAEDEGAAIKAKIENCSDPDSLKIYVKQAKDYADKLVREGDDLAAQAYLDEVTPVIQAKDPTAAEIFEKLKNDADNIIEEGKGATDSIMGTAKEQINESVEGAKDAVKGAVDAGKEKLNEGASKASDAAQKAVDEGKQNASDAIQKGADKLKKALN